MECALRFNPRGYCCVSQRLQLLECLFVVQRFDLRSNLEPVNVATLLPKVSFQPSTVVAIFHIPRFTCIG